MVELSLASAGVMGMYNHIHQIRSYYETKIAFSGTRMKCYHLDIKFHPQRFVCLRLGPQVAVLGRGD